MSAAAVIEMRPRRAALRKLAKSPEDEFSSPEIAERLQRERAAGGFVYYFACYNEALAGKLSGAVEPWLLMEILQVTQGKRKGKARKRGEGERWKPPSPKEVTEWTPDWSFAELADRARCSVQAIQEAVDDLLDRGFIYYEARAKGKYRFKCLCHRWREIEPLERSGGRKPPESTDRVLSAGMLQPRTTEALNTVLRGEEKAGAFETGVSNAVEGSGQIALPILSALAGRPVVADYDLSTPHEVQECVDAAQNVHVAIREQAPPPPDGLDDVRLRLNGKLRKTLGPIADDHCREVITGLGRDATLADLDAHIVARLSGGSIKSWKVVVLMARDTGAAAAKQRNAERRQLRAQQIEQEQDARTRAKALADEQAEYERRQRRLREHPEECGHCHGKGTVKRSGMPYPCNCPAGERKSGQQ